MTLISIIVPTITGREETLARCVESYERTLDGARYEIVVVKDEPNWPTACNEGFRQSKGDVLHFTADDLEALEGWHLEALLHLSVHDELPAPAVYDYREDGKFANEVDGPDGAVTHFTRIPIMRRDQWERIGEWPEIDYYADLWVSEKGRYLGIETRMVYSYRFVHHWSGIGRIDSERNLRKAWKALELLREDYEEVSA